MRHSGRRGREDDKLATALTRNGFDLRNEGGVIHPNLNLNLNLTARIRLFRPTLEPYK
jgi:hypothetical protein